MSRVRVQRGALVGAGLVLAACNAILGNEGASVTLGASDAGTSSGSNGSSSGSSGLLVVDDAGPSSSSSSSGGFSSASSASSGGVECGRCDCAAGDDACVPIVAAATKAAPTREGLFFTQADGNLLWTDDALAGGAPHTYTMVVDDVAAPYADDTGPCFPVVGGQLQRCEAPAAGAVSCNVVTAGADLVTVATASGTRVIGALSQPGPDGPLTVRQLTADGVASLTLVLTFSKGLVAADNADKVYVADQEHGGIWPLELAAAGGLGRKVDTESGVTAFGVDNDILVIAGGCASSLCSVDLREQTTVPSPLLAHDATIQRVLVAGNDVYFSSALGTFRCTLDACVVTVERLHAKPATAITRGMSYAYLTIDAQLYAVALSL